MVRCHSGGSPRLAQMSPSTTVEALRAGLRTLVGVVFFVVVLVVLAAFLAVSSASSALHPMFP
jgi:hypothetical protein